MATDDQLRASALHGEALIAAQDDVFRLLLARIADPDVTPEERGTIAGELAGGAFAEIGPGADYAEVGRRLIAAGLIIESGVTDRGRLAEVVRQAVPRHT